MAKERAKKREKEEGPVRRDSWTVGESKAVRRVGGKIGGVKMVKGSSAEGRRVRLVSPSEEIKRGGTIGEG